MQRDLDKTIEGEFREKFLSLQLPEVGLEESMQAILHTEIIKNSLGTLLDWVELESCKSLNEVRN